jgi:hypothetical protein
MIYFPVWQLGFALIKLKDIEDGARNHCAFLQNRDLTLPADYAQIVRGYIHYGRQQFAFIELGQAVLRLADNLILDLVRGFVTYGDLANHCHFLVEAVEAELKMRRFAYVPVARALKLDNIDNDWANVQAAFPTSKEDIRDAIECYALDKHTACIFHLMRVSEHGLRQLARKLQVTLSDKGKKQPLEYADWDKIVTAIRNKISDARKLPRGPTKEARLQSWSEAADHCEYMKDNWRNAVSHTRKPYTPTDAMQASDRVHAFMSFLAKSFKTKK